MDTPVTQRPPPQSSATVFVDNIHDDTTMGTLWKTFAPHGRIVSLNRPVRRRIVTNSRYAFVEFTSVQQAVRAINACNGMWVDGKRLCTHFARPLRRRRAVGCFPTSIPATPAVTSQPPPPPPQGTFFPLKQTWAPEIPTLYPEQDNSHGGPIKLAPSGVLIPCLDRSVKVRSKMKTNCEAVLNSLTDEEAIEHVVSSSAYDFIVIFRKKEDQMRFLQKSKWSKELWLVEGWENGAPQSSRMVNVAVRGMPPQAWSEESIKMVLTRFGKVIEIETNMDDLPQSLEVFVKLETFTSRIINEEVEVLFDNVITTVGVIKVWTEDMGERATPPGKKDTCKEPEAPVTMSVTEDTAVPMRNVDGTDNITMVEGVSFQIANVGMCIQIIHAVVELWEEFKRSPTWPWMRKKDGTEKSLLLSGSNKYFATYEDSLSYKLKQALLSAGNVDGSLMSSEVQEEAPVIGNKPPLSLPGASSDSVVRSIHENSTSDSSTNYSSEEDCQDTWFGSPIIPNNGSPTPVDGQSLKSIELHVELSPETSGAQKPIHNQHRSRKFKQLRCRPSAEARKCFKYGQRLRINFPYPSKSLANIDRILRRGGGKPTPKR